MVLFERGTVFSFRATDSPIIVQTKSRAAGSTSSFAKVCVFLHFTILYATSQAVPWQMCAKNLKIRSIAYSFLTSYEQKICVVFQISCCVC